MMFLQQGPEFAGAQDKNPSEISPIEFKFKCTHSERIHPVQLEFVAGQLSSGLQAVAVHLVPGHEHGDGTTLQKHFDITFL